MIRLEVVDELHALLWSKPLVNKGILDSGWNCRDHAIIVAALHLLSGNSPLPHIAHGANMLILGPNGRNHPSGFGQEIGLGAGHTWNLSLHGSIYDYSLKIPDKREHPQWKEIANPLVEDGVCRAISGAEVFMTDVPKKYQDCIAAGAWKEKGFRVCYLVRHQEEFSPKLLLSPFRWIDSPLSNKMKGRYGETIYVKIVLHLFDLSQGRAKSIVHKTQVGAWNTVARRSDNDIDRYLEIVRERTRNERG